MRRKKFSQGDWVTILYGEYQNGYGKVSILDKDGRYGVIPYSRENEPGAMVYFEPESIEKIKPMVFNKTELKKFLRGEKLYFEYAKDIFPAFNMKAKEKYALQAADIAQALENINKRDDCLQLFKEWFWVIINVFYHNLDIEGRISEDYMNDVPENDDEIFNVVYGMTERLYWGLEERFSFREDEERYFINFKDAPQWDKDRENTVLEKTAFKSVCDDIIGRVRSYEHNKDLPKSEWTYSSYQKKHIISEYENNESLEGASDEAIDMYRRFISDLEAEGDLQAIAALAWGYYEGNDAFMQNWFLAEKYLMQLYLKTGDPYAANSLGYIYYYGRTANGIPDYKKAFQYFSVGALAGVDESVYKAADMLIYGKGVPKNVDTGLDMIVDGYKDSCYRFCDGEYTCKFADFALRMGNICRDRLVYNMSLRDAYKFYIEAEFAIKKRREVTKYIGDGSVEVRIKNEIKKIREEIGIDPDCKELRADFPVYINQLYEERYPLKVTLKVRKGSKKGTLRVERYRIGNELQELFEEEEDTRLRRLFSPSQALLSFPELSWATLATGLTYYLEDVTVAQKNDKGPFFFSDGFRRNETTNAMEFYFQGELVGAVEAKWYVIKKEEKDGTGS